MFILNNGETLKNNSDKKKYMQNSNMCKIDTFAQQCKSVKFTEKS
jgi:hypothetical protein